jgi:hypothetical protein
LDGEQPVAALEQFLAERGQPLLHTAILLAGSRADGEDLLQVELTTPQEGTTAAQKTDFQWLAPTTANLANLTASIPPASSRPRPTPRSVALSHLPSQPPKGGTAHRQNPTRQASRWPFRKIYRIWVGTERRDPGRLPTVIRYISAA